MQDQFPAGKLDPAQQPPLQPKGIQRIQGARTLGSDTIRAGLRKLGARQSTPGYLPPGLDVEPQPDVVVAGVPGSHVVSSADMMRYPYSCIGRVDAAPAGSPQFQNAGSGVLVGPNLLLTATHLLKTRPLSQWTYRFVPAYHDGLQPAAPDGSNLVSALATGRVLMGDPTGKVNHGGVDTVNGWDFCILELDRRLGDVWGYMGVIWNNGSDFYESQQWITVGYPVSEGGRRPHRFFKVEISGVDKDDFGSRELETERFTDAGWGPFPSDPNQRKGWSGGPLFAFTNGGWYVGGVLSGWDLDGPIDIDGVDVFAGGPRLGVVHSEAYNAWGLAWSGWHLMEGGLFSSGVNPAAICRRPNSFEVFCRGTDNKIYQNYFQSSGSWSGWFPIEYPGEFSGDVAVCSSDPGHLQLFAVGMDGKMYSQYWLDHEGWSNWIVMEGGLFSPGVNPAAICRRPGSIELFCRGMDNTIYQNYYPSDGGWSGWFQIQYPGKFSGDVAVCSSDPGHLQLFGVGMDGKMYTQYWLDSEGWSNWIVMEGGLFSPGVNPAAICRRPGSIELFCRGMDNTIYQNYYPADNGWSGWFQVEHPAKFSGDVAVCSANSNHLQLFAVGADGRMYSQYWG